MFRLKNISPHSITLIKVTTDNNLDFVVVKANNYLDLNNLEEYLNITNLLDPAKGIFKVSIIN